MCAAGSGWLGSTFWPGKGGILDWAGEVDWDLVIFDEGHNLSATVWGDEVEKSKRCQRPKSWGSTRKLLMMTATPKSSKEERFQLFMALLDYYGF